MCTYFVCEIRSSASQLRDSLSKLRLRRSRSGSGSRSAYCTALRRVDVFLRLFCVLLWHGSWNWSSRRCRCRSWSHGCGSEFDVWCAGCRRPRSAGLPSCLPASPPQSGIERQQRRVQEEGEPCRLQSESTVQVGVCGQNAHHHDAEDAVTQVGQEEEHKQRPAGDTQRRRRFRHLQ
jgi:hypothetical protein